MHYFRKYGKYFLAAIFPAICWLIVNYAINRHCHQLSSGDIITHAHPYQKEDTNNSPFKSHHHSGFEILILDLISNILVLSGISFSYAFFQILIREIKVQAIQILSYSEPYTLQNYRGPPVLI